MRDETACVTRVVNKKKLENQDKKKNNTDLSEGRGVNLVKGSQSRIKGSLGTSKNLTHHSHQQQQQKRIGQFGISSPWRPKH